MRRLHVLPRACAPALPLLALSAPASAHAFGARYDLPLPLWLYLTGAGAAVALTFVVMALFLRERTDMRPAPEIALLTWHPEERSAASLLIAAIRAASVGLFLLIVAAGLLGKQNTIENLAPAMVWVIWWVGLAFASALIGDLWRLLNPWSTLHEWFERRVPASARRPYPAWLGVWPSVLLFVIFAWLELVSESGQSPRLLAIAILAYSLLTWAGMALYGRQTWLAHGEAFTRAFGLLARFAPLAAGERGDTARRLVLRPYASGLVVRKPLSFSMTVFVILMLSTVTFDGFVETPAWRDIVQWAAQETTIRPLLLAVQGAGIDLLGFLKTVALVLFPALFVAVYWGFSWLMAAAGHFEVATAMLARTLVLSLVPIAIAYHLAHYLSYLLLAGQLVIPLASDPFGWGWDLFGTAGYSMNIAIINAKTVWYTAVAAIVAGHVIAVYLAHVMALGLYRNARLALRSQLPMLVLMVLYTMTSLWILSQPIVAD